MISECLFDFNNPTELHKQFELNTKTPYPQILICPDEKEINIMMIKFITI